MSRRIEGKVFVGWKSFQFHIHNFAALSSTVDDYIASPEFTCNGRQWHLRVYPGGARAATGGYVSAFLHRITEGSSKATFEIRILDKFGNTKETITAKREFSFSDGHNGWGRKNFIPRSNILDESQNILDSDGTLTFVVSIEKEPALAFVPKNPIVKMMTEMFNDEATADVCFDVVNRADENEGKKESKSSASFHAHRLILRKCAPMLADLCGSNDDSGGMVAASVTDVKPDIFHHLLFYVYGGSVAEDELKAHAKDIIDAADKYSIVNLKLEAEAAYVETTAITMDNAIDNLLYADAKNCALLKEVVMDFLSENSIAASKNIFFADVPAYLMKDLLVAFGRKTKGDTDEGKDDSLTLLSVTELRKKLDEKGLDADGSREAMIEALKTNADESDSDDASDDSDASSASHFLVA